MLDRSRCYVYRADGPTSSQPAEHAYSGTHGGLVGNGGAAP